ncbi:MAG: hypothetical protein QOI42_120, partial [Frankiaceae bacterium]|nr:hypothetical protein [Frankiaceae bacterium]
GPTTATVARPAAPGPGGGPAAPARGPRRAKLAIASVDPWSVFRFTLVFSVTILIVWLVVAAVLFELLRSMGVLDSLTTMINTTFISASGDRTVDQLFDFKRLMLWAGGLGVINAILFTALGTLGAFVYNLCARIVGGFEVTLTDR